MDIDKWMQFAIANFSQYFSVTVETLTRPGLRFAPVAVPAGGEEAGIATGKTGSQLNPQLVGFAVLSMFLGLTMNSLITKQPSGKELVAIEIVGLLFWFLYAAVVHFFCKLVKGRGTFLETVSVTVQVFATLYVLCSVLATTLAMIILIKPVKAYVAGLGGGLGQMVTDNPVTLFFLIHTILLLIYLPRALKPVHGFNLLQQIAVAIPTGFLILVHGVAMLFLTGTFWSVEVPVASSGRGAAASVALYRAPVSRPAAAVHRKTAA
jgi:Yip1-like protein